MDLAEVHHFEASQRGDRKGAALLKVKVPWVPWCGKKCWQIGSNWGLQLFSLEASRS